MVEAKTFEDLDSETLPPELKDPPQNQFFTVEVSLSEINAKAAFEAAVSLICEGIQRNSYCNKCIFMKKVLHN